MRMPLHNSFKESYSYNNINKQLDATITVY